MSVVTLALIISGILIIFVIIAYNSLIQLINRTNEAWADINVQLKRRYDLIPNLIDLVKVYAKHEKKVFAEVTEARSRALSAQSVQEKDASDDSVRSALSKLFAIAEDYPQLRAAENFAKLQDELTKTENMIASARRFYNGNVRDLNTKIESFPDNLVAKIFQFQKRDFFQLDQ